MSPASVVRVLTPRQCHDPHGVYEAAQEAQSPQCAAGMLQSSASGHFWVSHLHRVAFAIVQTWRGPLLEDGHLMCQTIATAKALTARFWKDDAGQDALLWMQNSQPKPPSKITAYSLRNHV